MDTATVAGIFSITTLCPLALKLIPALHAVQVAVINLALHDGIR